MDLHLCKGVPDHQDCMFNCWEPSRYHTLEQRYQQLAEVALKMVEHMQSLYNFGDPPLGTRVAEFRKQLEELGVEL